MHLALLQCSVCGAKAWGCANWSMTYGGWKTHLCGFLCEVCSAPSMGWLMPPAGMVYLPGEIEEMHQVVRVAGGHSIPQDACREPAIRSAPTSVGIARPVAVRDMEDRARRGQASCGLVCGVQ